MCVLVGVCVYVCVPMVVAVITLVHVSEPGKAENRPCVQLLQAAAYLCAFMHMLCTFLCVVCVRVFMYANVCVCVLCVAVYVGVVCVMFVHVYILVLVGVCGVVM